MSSGGSRELTNEEKERMMYEWMERMEKQIETLATVLQEIREGQRGGGEMSQVQNPSVAGLVDGVAQDEQDPIKGIRDHGGQDDRVNDQPRVN